METFLKLGFISFLILLVLAIVTHLDVLLAFVGQSIVAFMPMIILVVVIFYLIKSIFR